MNLFKRKKATIRIEDINARIQREELRRRKLQEQVDALQMKVEGIARATQHSADN